MGNLYVLPKGLREIATSLLLLSRVDDEDDRIARTSGDAGWC